MQPCQGPTTTADDPKERIRIKDQLPQPGNWGTNNSWPSGAIVTKGSLLCNPRRSKKQKSVA